MRKTFPPKEMVALIKMMPKKKWAIPVGSSQADHGISSQTEITVA